MGRPFKCPYCGSHHTVSKGTRSTKTMGKRKLRRCKGCHRKFTPKNQLSYYPNDDDMIPESSDSRGNGSGSAEIANLLPRPPSSE